MKYSQILKGVGEFGTKQKQRLSRYNIQDIHVTSEELGRIQVVN